MDVSKVEESAKEKVFQVLEPSKEMQNRRGEELLRPDEAFQLQEIKDEVVNFLNYQQRGLSCLRIQSVWRWYRDFKKFKECQRVYVKGRNTRVHDMLQREIVYTTLITQLAQRFAVPLLNTPDRVLKEESNDIHEILHAIIDIERLHR